MCKCIGQYLNYILQKLMCSWVKVSDENFILLYYFIIILNFTMILYHYSKTAVI